MKNDIFSDAIEQIEKSKQEEMVSDTATINIRPGAKLSAMLEILGILKGKTVSSILFEEIPNELEDAILTYSKGHEVINNTVCELIDEYNEDKEADPMHRMLIEANSVLDKLEEKQLIVIDSLRAKDFKKTLDGIFGSRKA